MIISFLLVDFGDWGVRFLVLCWELAVMLVVVPSGGWLDCIEQRPVVSQPELPATWLLPVSAFPEKTQQNLTIIHPE